MSTESATIGPEVHAHRAVIGIGIFAILACTGIALAMHFWQVLPLWDQWETVFLYQRWSEHGWSVQDLVAQHNEHRHLWANLLFLADYEFFRGTSWLTWSGLLVTQLSLGAVIGTLITAGHAGLHRAFGVMLSIALIVSPFNIDNLILPFHVSIPLVTGMRITVPAHLAGTTLVLAYGVDHPGRGAPGARQWAGRFVR